jgi:hypothetical protein
MSTRNPPVIALDLAAGVSGADVQLAEPDTSERLQDRFGLRPRASFELHSDRA